MDCVKEICLNLIEGVNFIEFYRHKYGSMILIRGGLCKRDMSQFN